MHVASLAPVLYYNNITTASLIVMPKQQLASHMDCPTRRKARTFPRKLNLLIPVTRAIHVHLPYQMWIAVMMSLKPSKFSSLATSTD